MRDPDVTLLVAVARSYPDRFGIRVELHGVDVTDGPRRKLEGFVPALPSSLLFQMQTGCAPGSVVYSPK